MVSSELDALLERGYAQLAAHPLGTGSGVESATLYELWELSEQGSKKLTDSDVTAAMFALSIEFATDVDRFWPYLRSGSDFVREVGQRNELSVGMARGVLNVLIAAIRGQRKRWWSTGRHPDGKGICLVCGLVLDDEESARRGCGPVCWKYLMGNWS